MGFYDHIALSLSQYITCPEERTIFEIGHGGGRILAAAGKSLKKAIGIDIHDHNELVKNELAKRGILNIELHKTNGQKIPIEDNAVDVVYSFIVLQHVERIEIFKSYLKEAYRVLRPGGVALLYFGRKTFLSHNKKSSFLYWFDCLLENLTQRQGYREIPTRVNEINLLVSAKFAGKLSHSSGFRVLRKVVSHKKVPDGVALYGGQHGLVLMKNALT